MPEDKMDDLEFTAEEMVPPLRMWGKLPARRLLRLGFLCTLSGVRQSWRYMPTALKKSLRPFIKSKRMANPNDPRPPKTSAHVCGPEWIGQIQPGSAILQGFLR